MRPLASLLLLLALLYTAPAGAHLMPAGQGTINLVGTDAYVVISVPVAAFTGVDQDGDGMLSAPELAAGQATLRAAILAGMALDGGRWQEVMLSLPSAGEPGAPPSPDLMVMAVASFTTPPAVLAFTSRLWGPAASTIRLTATVSEGSRTLQQEAGLISRANPGFTFFAPRSAVLASFFTLGFHHILSGPDHLLFLVTVLAAGIAWRRWLALLTAFTIAHGATFALASLGVVSLPARLVEAAIAASIVAVALAVLMRVSLRLWQETALVFGLGLAHGLGFAAAIAGHGMPASHPATGIIGFNLGVEAGQLLVALTLYGAVLLLRRIPAMASDAQWQRAIAFGAVLIGSVWMVERGLQS